MALPHANYLRATCHPWSCLVFLLPLLLAYEGGILWMGGAQGEGLRNGADAWLRWGLQTFGLGAMYWPPILILSIFVVWNWLRWFDRPGDLFGIWLGMAVESVGFALALWGLGHMQNPLWQEMGLLAVESSAEAEPVSRMALMLSFVGAGIYEELLFRLLLFPVLLGFMGVIEMPWPMSTGFAMLLSALAFAVAHHVGPYGEVFQAETFLFRTLAGLYFGVLFRSRGFGVAVGTHACYDVLVGVAMS